MATPTKSQIVSTPKNALNTTPNRPTASPRPNVGAFAPRGFAGKSPAVKTPASLQGTHRISVSSHPTSTPLAASVLPEDLGSFNSPAAAAFIASMTGTGATPLLNMPADLIIDANPQEPSSMKDPQNERHTRLKEVANTLKKRMAGRGVTRESVETLAHIQGFAALWDENLLQIAGEKFVDLEITFDEQDRNVVQKTSLKLNLPGQDEGILHEAASQVLKENLTSSSNRDHPWYQLDDFSANLDYLSKLEHIDTSANCFKVLDNLYDTFQKIWAEEKKRMKWRHDAHHLCQSNVGEPRKDKDRRLEMSTKYWTSGSQFFHVQNSKLKKQDKKEGRDWTAKFLIETGRPSIATAQTWLAEDPLTSTVTAEDLFQDSSVDKPAWLDPSLLGNKLLENAGTNAARIPSNPADTLNIRFTCSLEPRILLPANVVRSLNETFPMIQVQEKKITSYLHVMNNIKDMKSESNPNQQWTKTQHSFSKTGAKQERVHSYTLYASTELKTYPTSMFTFSHPAQYANALPFLRQHALTDTLLQSILPKDSTKPKPVNIEPKALPDRSKIIKRSNKPKIADKISSLLDSRSVKPNDLPIDIHVDPVSSPTKACKLELSIPLSQRYFERSALAARQASPFLVIKVDILLNGIVEVIVVEGVRVDKDELESLKKKLAKVLRLSEDLGVVVEWVLRELSL